MKVKEITDRKIFWVTIKLLISNKSCIRDRICISEKGEILKIESETAETLNDLFSNIVKNLYISRYSEHNSVTEKIAEPSHRVFWKYKDYPSLLAI